MISNILSYKNSSKWLIFHAVLGLISTLTPYSIIIWFWFIVFYQLLNINKNIKLNIVYLVVYLSSLEAICRYSNTSPFVPYEIGKYSIFVLIIIGIIKGSKQNLKSGFLIILLFIPGIFLGLNQISNPSVFSDLVFNVLGSINIVLIIMFFYKTNISKNQFIGLFRLYLYPSVSALFFVIFKSQDISSIEFGLGANFDAVANLSTNQVSTIFGGSILVLSIMIFEKWKFTKYDVINFSLLILFIFRAFFSFSKGGIIVSALTFFIYLFLKNKSKKYFSTKRIMRSVTVILIFLISFFVTNKITNGQLLLRFQGETTGTISGNREVSLSTLTTGRNMIFFEDLNIFNEHTFFGVGVGQSKKYRLLTKQQSAHIELSRLLAEHGLFGLIIFLWIISIGFSLLRNKNIPLRNILISLYCYSLFTSFHSATRTSLSFLFFGISVLLINDFKSKISNNILNKS